MNSRINAKRQLNGDPEHARAVIAELRRRGMTSEDIAALAGLHIRSLYRVQKTGFVKFPMQYILERMAGMRVNG